LGRVVAKTRGTTGEDQCRLATPDVRDAEPIKGCAVAFLRDCHRHRGSPVRARTDALKVEPIQVALNLLSQRAIEQHVDATQ
jgi:hypothetical protein